ncbi:MAG: hypothetical protein KatS3mg102_1148 [Planctomycetota bacterium]|nr:MAG: hypothetical protein KatS3mg102_1148 [Planctomycetota bacterium]
MNRILCKSLLVVWVLAAAAAGSAAEQDPVARLCTAYSGFDLDGDGTLEIEALAPLLPEAGAARAEAGTPPLVLVLVEARLLRPLAEERTAPPAGRVPGVAALRAALARFARDLGEEGWRARVLLASVYAGPRHQDGKTLLALRRFLRAVWQAEPALAGAVLVGRFPEALLVRSYNWRKRGQLVLHRGSPQQQRFTEGVPYLATIPEAVAMPCELVLCDLDGNWEERYIERRERLPGLIAVFPDGIPPRGGVAPYWEWRPQVYEDFFFVNDGHLHAREVLRPRADGQSGDEVVGLDVEIFDEQQDAECSAADRERPNPIARPEIVVSRLNPYGIALRPRAAVRGLGGEGLLDAAGRPQPVVFAEPAAVPRPRELWEPDPALERQLLIEYFTRNHRYRHGAYDHALGPAAIGHGLGSGWQAMRRAVPAWRTFAEPGYDGGSQASLLEVVQWLGRPAGVRELRAHTDAWGAQFGRAEPRALLQAAGGIPWHWEQQGTRLVPALPRAGTKLDFPLLRTLWQNRVLPEQGSLYVHIGCDSVKPAGGAALPYSDPRYGYWQGAAALLFYGQGLALIGRGKVFYDSPRGLYRALGEGECFGEGWRRYFELESAAGSPAEVGGGIGRKRAYFWSVLGDFTLRLRAASGGGRGPAVRRLL